MKPAESVPVAEDLSEDSTDHRLHESFELFYARERSSVVGLAFVLSGSSAAAEDLAQDAFFQALKSWEEIGSYDDPGAWVRRVVANHSVSRYRRTVAETKAMLRFGSTQQTFQIDEHTALMWEEVRRLPKRQAQAIALRYFEGRTIADIASMLDCSENTVKTHILRAKQTLALRLNKETDDEPD